MYVVCTPPPTRPDAPTCSINPPPVSDLADPNTQGFVPCREIVGFSACREASATSEATKSVRPLRLSWRQRARARLGLICTSPPSQMAMHGIVKSVLSGDSVIVMGADASKGPPPEKLLTLSSKVQETTEVLAALADCYCIPEIPER